MTHSFKDGKSEGRRTFLKTLSLALASGLIFGVKHLFASEAPLVRPPGPPTPPAPTPFQQPDPPYAKEIPSIPFDAPPGSWTLVVLPDTQNMSATVPPEYLRQIEWIVAHREKHQILFVAHEGDIVENCVVRAEWEHAQKAMRTLTQAGIPYSLLPGNHDLGDGKAIANSRTTLLNDYFTADDYRHSEAMGLFEQGKMENSWHEFTAPTGKYLLLALEYGPRNAVVDWANKIVAQKPDRKVIVVTHAHLYHDNTRYDWKKKGGSQEFNPYTNGIAQAGGVNDGEDLWNKLLKKKIETSFWSFAAMIFTTARAI